MKQQFNYTSIETIFAKFSRDLRNTDIHESDVIEWVGEALDFMKIVEIQEEAIAFIEVKDYRAELPRGFQSVIQIARNNRWTGPDDTCSPSSISEAINEQPSDGCRGLIITNCKGEIVCGEENVSYYRPNFDLKWEYEGWSSSKYYKASYSPVRLANHTFFNSVVCKEPDYMAQIYAAAVDEYTLAGGYPNMELRFSFQSGYIALAYVRSMVDPDTGYPLIPDDIRFISAATYYVKWKMSERLRWDGREGYAQEAKEAEAMWNKYSRQAMNMAKMPKGVDQYQNILEQSLYMIPRHRKFAGFFGNLGREEDRSFTNPRRRY